MMKTTILARMFAIALIISCLFPFTALGEEVKPRVYLYFFHNNPCEACQEVDKLYDIADETDAWDLARLSINEFREYTSDFNYGVEIIMKWFGLEKKPMAPFLVVGNTVLEGYDAMKEGLNAAVAQAIEEEYIFSEANVHEYGSLKASPAASEARDWKWMPIAASAAAAILIVVQRRSRKHAQS